jgi:hypothetical protein
MALRYPAASGFDPAPCPRLAVAEEAPALPSIAAAEDQAVVASEFVDIHRLTTLGDVGRRGTKHDLVLCDHAGDQTRVCGRFSKIKAFLDDVRLAVGETYLDLNVRPGL